MLLEMALGEQDLLKIQSAFPDLRTELRGGKVIVMSPSGFVSERVVTSLCSRLNTWVEGRSLGHVVGSSGGFVLPNGDIVGPDVAYVSRERLPVAPRSFARVVPDLATEVMSPSDRISDVQEKLAMLRGQGVRTVALVDPDEHTVAIDSEGDAPRVLGDAEFIEFHAVLPGWSMAVSDLWPKDLSA